MPIETRYSNKNLVVTIASDTRFHTVYTVDGRPAGTIVQRQVNDKTSPKWTVYDLNAVEVAHHQLSLIKTMLRELAERSA